MLYFLIVLICGIIMAVSLLIKKEPDGAIVCGVCTLIALAAVFMCLNIYTDQNESDYIKYRYDENPVTIQNLEPLPFENPSSDAIYLVREEDTFGNFNYTYCIKTELGYEEKTVKRSLFGDVYINYIVENEQPRFECQSDSQKEILAKKPSFWFNFIGWLQYKDVSIGEVIDVNGAHDINYIFYVPEGSLRDIS